MPPAPRLRRIAVAVLLAASPYAAAWAEGVVAAPGLVEPIGEEREIGSEVIGVVREMRVDENEAVSAGQIVAVIDNAEQTARLAAARATLALRKAERDRVVNGARPEARREAAAVLREAQATLLLARQQFQRRLPMARTGVESAEALDLATSAMQAAEARAAAAHERLALIEAPARAEDVAAAEAQVAQAEADVALAQALLDKTLVRTPIAGPVLRRYRVAGEAVSNQPPTPIAVVGDLSRLRVRAEVDETDIGRAAPGQRVDITADAYAGQHFGGTVKRVAQRMGSKAINTGRASDKTDTKVLQVLIDLDPDVRLPIGLRVDAYLNRAPVK